MRNELWEENQVKNGARKKGGGNAEVLGNNNETGRERRGGRGKSLSILIRMCKTTYF